MLRFAGIPRLGWNDERCTILGKPHAGVFRRDEHLDGAGHVASFEGRGSFAGPRGMKGVAGKVPAAHTRAGTSPRYSPCPAKTTTASTPENTSSRVPAMSLDPPRGSCMATSAPGPPQRTAPPACSNVIRVGDERPSPSRATREPAPASTLPDVEGLPAGRDRRHGAGGRGLDAARGVVDLRLAGPVARLSMIAASLRSVTRISHTSYGGLRRTLDKQNRR